MLNQNQSQKLQNRILPQQIHLLNLFFLNEIELEQRIANELNENPLLENVETVTPTEEVIDQSDVRDDWGYKSEDDIPNYRMEMANYISEPVPNKPIAFEVDFRTAAHEQLSLFDIPQDIMELGHLIIDSLDARGMLDKPIEELESDLSFLLQKPIEIEAIEAALAYVKQLEPVGLGSQTIQECLSAQLQKMDRTQPIIALANKLISKYYTEFVQRKFEVLANKLRIDEQQLKVVFSEIGKLNFYPVLDSGSIGDMKNAITPDFLIKIEKGKPVVTLAKSRFNSIRVNDTLHDEWLNNCPKKNKEASQYIKQKRQQAYWFVNGLQQREETMLDIMNCIVMLQKEYFMEGDIRLLKPMVIRNVSDLTGHYISTISRITSNKFAETHFGIVCLKDLFSEGVMNERGNKISNKVIQSVIKEIIDAEDKDNPLTDFAIVEKLQERGYKVARRTVAKYRDILGIPIAQLRSFQSKF